MRKALIIIVIFFGFLSTAAKADEMLSDIKFNGKEYELNLPSLEDKLSGTSIGLGLYDYNSRWKPGDNDEFDSTDIDQTHVYIDFGFETEDIGISFKIGMADIAADVIFADGDEFEDSATIFYELGIEAALYTHAIGSIRAFTSFDWYGPYEDEDKGIGAFTGSTEEMDIKNRWGWELGVLFANPRDAKFRFFWGPFFYFHRMKVESTDTSGLAFGTTSTFDTSYRENGRLGLKFGGGINITSNLAVSGQFITRSHPSWLVSLDLYL